MPRKKKAAVRLSSGGRTAGASLPEAVSALIALSTGHADTLDVSGIDEKVAALLGTDAASMPGPIPVSP